MRIDGFRPLSQRSSARRAGRTRPADQEGSEHRMPALIEATAQIPNEAEFERMGNLPVRVLSPLTVPSGKTLEALSSYTRIAALVDEQPVRHYIDLYA